MHPVSKYRAWLIGGLAIVAAHLLDGWGWAHLYRAGVYDADMGRMFRMVGYLPIWLLLAIAYWLHTRDRRRALMLGLVPALGGLAAEVLKILLRRERPKLHDGEYVFRAFSDNFWATTDIGLPSSHALVAFAGAWLLCRMWPRAWPIWLLLAAGCALTRVQAQAHFVSDVVVAAVVAYGVAAAVGGRGESRGAPSLRGGKAPEAIP